jgi:hypothetical protein
MFLFSQKRKITPGPGIEPGYPEGNKLAELDTLHGQAD